MTSSPEKVFRRLFGYLRPQYGLLILAIVLMLAGTPCELFPAMAWMYAADCIIQNKYAAHPWLQAFFSLGETLHGWKALTISTLVLLFLVYAVGEFLGTISNWMMQRIAQRFIVDIRNRVYVKLQGQSLAYHQRQRTGDLMSRAMGDVDELNSFIVGGIDVILGEGVLWLATVAIVFSLDWRVAGASLCPLIIVYLMLRVFNKKVKPIYELARTRAGEVTARLQENLSGVIVIKAFAREKAEAARFRDATAAYYDAQAKAINARSIYFPFTRAIGFFSNVNMVGVGVWSIMTGRGFTLGKLVAFRAYWFRLFGPIQTLARVNDMVQRAKAAGRRVFEVLDAPEELPDSPGARALGKVIGDMRLETVSFAYKTETKPGEAPPVVLREVSVEIPAGKIVALCGPSGSGKSTVLAMLMRFYDPDAGRVTLDGVSLRDIERGDLRRHFAYVQQETFLFNDSILDNLKYGHAEATQAQVLAATKAANAHEFIERLPHGYDTKVGERGVRLSGGQKQRLSIARAYMANPAVLLLDEPTSSVEPESEAAIIAALLELMKGRTTVLTSHRPSLIARADIVYVLEAGRVVARGSPGEVVHQNEWFSRFMGEAL